MHLARAALLLGLLFAAQLFAAQFREYYRSGEQVAPQQPAPQPQQPVIRRVQPPAQTPVQQTRPAAPLPAAAPRRIVREAPAGHFGFGGNWLVRGAFATVAQSRLVSVATRDTSDEVYYKPGNKLMGTADGSTLTHTAGDLLFGFQLGAGYQLPRDGNFWFLDFSSAGDTQELLLSFAWTLPRYAFSGSIPYVKALGGIGHVDAEGLAPTAFSLGLGIGAYNWLTAQRNWRLEYGLDLTRREWLPIRHDYGNEEWVDNEWRLYLGAAWRF